MALNDIIDNVVSTISGDSDYQSWVSGIYGRNPTSAKCKGEDEALKLPAAQDMPRSMVFSLPEEPDYDSNTASRALAGISIITWLFQYDDSRVLADDLRTAKDYIIKALIDDDTRGGYSWYCDIVAIGEPVTEEDPAGYIRIDLEVYYTIQEAS